jgi:hypothetical protein
VYGGEDTEVLELLRAVIPFRVKFEKTDNGLYAAFLRALWFGVPGVPAPKNVVCVPS